MAQRVDIIKELTTPSNRETILTPDALLEPKFLIFCRLLEGCRPI